jgi:hypothetical protein
MLSVKPQGLYGSFLAIAPYGRAPASFESHTYSI